MQIRKRGYLLNHMMHPCSLMIRFQNHKGQLLTAFEKLKAQGSTFFGFVALLLIFSLFGWLDQPFDII
jgi:hypothetical protein